MSESYDIDNLVLEMLSNMLSTVGPT